MRRSLAAAVAAALLTPAPASACSLVNRINPFFIPGTAMMLATATADSMFAGPGDVKWALAPGHNGPTFDRPIYGQVMRVDSARGPGSRAASRVVLVPWDYGADCRPTPWGNSFLWRRLGTAGVYRGMLRDSAHWAGGLPTYDVFAPEFEPYTTRPGGAGAAAQREQKAKAEPLTAEELFAIARFFPVIRNYDEVDSAATIFMAWVKANPQLASRPPLASGVDLAEQVIQRTRMNRIDVPMRGTYRVTFIVGADSAVFYGRTMKFVDGAWPGAHDGYNVAIYVAPDLAGLARAEHNSYLYLPSTPTTSDAIRRTWSGEIEPNIVRRGLADAPIGQVTLQMMPTIPARFTVAADGSATFEHRSVLKDGRPVVIRGVRISGDVY